MSGYEGGTVTIAMSVLRYVHMRETVYKWNSRMFYYSVTNVISVSALNDLRSILQPAVSSPVGRVFRCGKKSSI